MPSENESFASRWSRRKHQVEAVDTELPADTDDVIDLEKQREQKLAKLNALTDEDMPDVETLGEDSEYAGFMSINVSEELRKMALRKLFHGKTYNIRDGLDEYDGDYTSFEKLDPSIITADMKHLLEVEAEKLLAKEEAEKAQMQEQEQEIASTELLDGEGDEKDELISEVADVELDTKPNLESNEELT